MRKPLRGRSCDRSCLCYQRALDVSTDTWPAPTKRVTWRISLATLGRAVLRDRSDFHERLKLGTSHLGVKAFCGLCALICVVFSQNICITASQIKSPRALYTPQPPSPFYSTSKPQTASMPETFLTPTADTAHASRSVGQLLKDGRLGRGLSLADVATVTRIPRNMLAHLEQDEFDEYRASVFVRGHLTNYARELQLDVDALLSAYDRQSGKLPASSSEPELAAAPAARALPLSARLAAVRRARPAAQTASRPPATRRLQQLSGTIQPIHMVAALLVVFALVTCVFFLGNSQSATAQAPSAFSNTEAPAQQWGHEKDVNQARWFLEQGAAHAAP